MLGLSIDLSIKITNHYLNVLIKELRDRLKRNRYMLKS